jgi:hypothetical protein
MEAICLTRLRSRWQGCIKQKGCTILLVLLREFVFVEMILQIFLFLFLSVLGFELTWLVYMASELIMLQNLSQQFWGFFILGLYLLRQFRIVSCIHRKENVRVDLRSYWGFLFVYLLFALLFLLISLSQNPLHLLEGRSFLQNPVA